MNERRDPRLEYARFLYSVLEDLRDKVRDHCPAMPALESCMLMADVALIKARRDGINGEVK